jgi:hypothetical protein
MSTQSRVSHTPVQKWLAEQCVAAEVKGTACALTIVRPALMFDVELVANLQRLRQLVRRTGLAFPEVGSRSLVSRRDVAELLCQLVRSASLDRPQAPRRIAATDGGCYSAGRISRALGHSGRIMPIGLLRLAAVSRDLFAGQPPGSTWQQLSATHWCGALSAAPEWCPRYTLELQQADRP